MTCRKIKLILFSLIMLTACGEKKKTNASTKPTVTQQQETFSFNADSALLFVKNQTDFGPRVPNTKAQIECANFFVEKFTAYGADVTVQDFEAIGWDKVKWKGKNIIAKFDSQNNDRILLCSHWDSRYIAEQDKNKDLQKTPIDGANDGASGVGVLIEIARQLQLKSPNIGIDIVLFDVEDQGAPYYASSTETEDSWCLGSQYWAHQVAKDNNKPKYGILLDMVGAGDAVFMKEQISMYYASNVVEYVWATAINMGFSDYFINEKGGIVTDDHLYVNKIANIPCIDIIDFDNNRGGFNHTWHTHDDNIDNIDKNTLNAIGSVLLKVIYEQ